MDASAAKKLTGQLMERVRIHPMTRHLSENAFNILGRNFFLAFLHGMNSKTGAIYSVASQKYLARAVGVHRVTVARIVSMLRSQGLLNITRRRPVKGQWTTNLCRIGKLVWILFGNIINRFRRFFNHVARALHIVSEEKKYFNPRQQTKDFSFKLKSQEVTDIIKRVENAHPELV